MTTVDELLASVEPSRDWRIVTRSHGGAEVHSAPCGGRASVVLRTFCSCGGMSVDLVCDEHIRRRPQAFVYCAACGGSSRCLGQSVERWT